jgi:serine protease Do
MNDTYRTGYGRHRHIIALALLAGLMVHGVSAQEAQEEVQILKKAGKGFSEVAKKAIPAVVFIDVEKTVGIDAPGRQPFNNPHDLFGDEFMRRFFGQPARPAPRQFRTQGQGSGFLISKDGYILTNNHVVGDADSIQVRLQDGRTFEAKRVGTDPRSEVAVIKIEGADFPFVTLGDSDKLDIGEWVIAVGNPFGLSATLTVGVVSAKGRIIQDIADSVDFIQTDAAINPGNSGGPLLNIDGEVIGINTAIYSQSGGYMGIGFAIPSNLARSIKAQLIKTGKVSRGQIGIVIQDVDEALAKQFGLDAARGILIDAVMEGSAGEKAGLQLGDIILEIDGKAVESTAAFRNLVMGNPPGTQFSLTLFRDGKEIKRVVASGSADEESALSEQDRVLFEKLGMTLQNMTAEVAAQMGYGEGDGVVVAQVAPGGQAARLGIRPGYLVDHVARRKVATIKDFREAVRKSAANGRVMLRIRGPRFAQHVIMSVE